jgi:hypothetical protein
MFSVKRIFQMQVSNFDSRLIISNFELLIITVSIKFYLKSTSSDNILIEVNPLTDDPKAISR